MRLIICLVLCVTSAVSFGSSFFEYKDLFKASYSTKPLISESGKFFSYKKSSANIMTDSFDSTFHVVNTKSSKEVDLEGSPQMWIGESLLYTKSSSTGGTSVYLFNLMNNERELVYASSDSIFKIKIFRNKKHLVFLKSDSIDNNLPDIKLPNKPDGAVWARPSVRTSKYYNDGSAKESITKLFVADLKTSQETEVKANGFYFHTDFVLNNKRNEIYFNAIKTSYEYYENQLYKFDISNSKVSKLYTTTSKTSKMPSSVNKRGNMLVLGERKIRFSMTDPIDLYVLNLNTNKKSLLVRSSRRYHIHWWNLVTYWFGEKIHFSYVNKGLTKTALVDLSGSIKKLPLTVGSDMFHQPHYQFGEAYSIAPNGTIAYIATSAKTPPEISIAQVDKRRGRVLTKNSKKLLSGKIVGRIEEVFHRSSYDNESVQGWLVMPPKFDASKKYPLVTYLHGGPYLGYGPYFSMIAQLYAAKGYIVYLPNYRASIGYGTKFMEAKPGVPARIADVLSGVKNLLKRDYIDPSLNFVTGASAGGFLTNWLVASSDIFTAGSSLATISNDLAATLDQDYDLIGYINYVYNGVAPWDKLDGYIKNSVIFHARQIKTPLLLMQGANDKNTKPNQAIQLFNALSDLGVDTELILMKDTGHALSRNITTTMRRVEFSNMWFKKYFY